MKKILDTYFRFLKVLLTVLMGVLIIPVTVQILSRYVGFVPRYIWTEELARFCFIWIILVGSMIAVRENEHFMVDLLPEAKTQRGKAISLILVDFMTFLMAESSSSGAGRWSNSACCKPPKWRNCRWSSSTWPGR